MRLKGVVPITREYLNTTAAFLIVYARIGAAAVAPRVPALKTRQG